MQRVTDLADPRRCKGRSLDGQCQNVVEEGSDYCRVHGGESLAPDRRLKQYLLTTAQDCARLSPHFRKRRAENDARGVVALGLLERRLSLAKTDAEFIMPFRRSSGSAADRRSQEGQPLPGNEIRGDALAGPGVRAVSGNRRDRH